MKTALKSSHSVDTAEQPKLSGDMQRLIAGQLHDPLRVLGNQHGFGDKVIRAYLPGAQSVYIERPDYLMTRVGQTDLFEYRGDHDFPPHYSLVWTDNNDQHGEWGHRCIDPYSFDNQISDYDLYLIRQGKHLKIYQLLGANPKTIEGIEGIFFGVWAPNAQRVSVVGDFNHWQGLRHPMRCRGDSGIWELFIPELEAEHCYKFEICHQHSGNISQKIDVYGRQFENRPKTAAIIRPADDYVWQDQAWLEHRRQWDWQHAPMSIYELHAGSWRQHPDGSFLNYRELAQQLVPYVKSLGFTHIELLPITEHPLDASWGYQTLGYFAPSSRFGNADDFRYFVDYCHQNNIAVLLDWVASHFPRDDHGLSQYDGSALYEYADPKKGEHQQWGTLVFNYERNEVQNFLLANALFWLDEFHLDGLRVDAVASMLYLDYNRDDGQWQPNIYGGNENLEGVSFLRSLNEIVHQQFPGVTVIAEESTAWPQVSGPTYLGGLGFTMKWNMGWMHDTLDYMNKQPVHRRYHHDKLTFGMLYAYSENFVLALSHDEVVHEKCSLLQKMPGDDWQKFANLRLLYSYMFSYPGKKLLFMGSEFAQRNEWQHDHPLDWHLLEHHSHQGMAKVITDLNHLYQHNPALHELDFDQAGFEWIDCHDSDQSVLVYLRQCEQQQIVVALNFTPVPRYQYRIGIPNATRYREIFNSDADCYGGSNVGNLGKVTVEPIAWMGHKQSITITLPPLAGILLIAEQ